MNQQVAICLILFIANAIISCDRETEQSDIAKVEQAQPQTTMVKPKPDYVGVQACTECHAKEVNAWQGSQHDQAMQLATIDTVLGNFDNAEFNYNGVKTAFRRDGDNFIVNTDGPDGKLHDYTIKYTFGVFPLQQYLIEMEDGRVQALGIAWDSRNKEAGGQRWFHLYPEQKVDSKNELHWTGLQQNWNFMCTECHSTHVEKNYRAESNTFATSFSEINVACEACHGPGSNHIAWAKQHAPWPALNDQQKGLVVLFDERTGVQWLPITETGNARRSTPRTSSKELDTCAVCHSRRSQLSEQVVAGQPIGNSHRVSLLEQHLYFSDGQPNDETYVYGSFQQSKMYHKGVTCSDCHEPHSLKLRAPGDQVCYQCHQPDKYATTEHHFHPQDSKGTSCIECHMPVKTFMVVDPRYDHSFRIPRPDLTETMNTPNTCTQCHTDKSTKWAAAKVKQWYGKTPQGFQDYAQLLQAARQGDPAVRDALLAYVNDESHPAIVRATLVTTLPGYLSRQTAEVLTAMTSASDPLIRRAAADAFSNIDPRARAQWLGPLLTDAIKDVRISAARALADVDAQYIPPDVHISLQLALDEYIATQTLNADRPEGHVNLGLLAVAQRDPVKAEAEYKQALELDPSFVPAIVNLVDLYRATDRDAEAETLLRDAIAKYPDQPALLHSLGLLLVRQQKLADSMKLLQRAAQLAPEDTRYAYVYAVALHSSGKAKEAIAELKKLLQRHPYDRESLWAIYSFYNEKGEASQAQAYLQTLQQLEPDNPNLPK